MQSIRRVDVYRVAEKSNAPAAMTEEEFSSLATLIGSVTYDEIKKAGSTLTYVDTLELAEPARLRYAVRYVNAAGQSAAFSNFFQMEPAAKVAGPPTIIKTGTEYSETANTITWETPKANTDGSTPVNLLGYNIYRTKNGAPPLTGQSPLNPQPITATRYEDRKFTFGEKYLYVVRSVSLGTEGKPVESLNSKSIELSPVDTYPPAAPEHPTIGPSPGKLSIFWVANSEPDLAGYYLYRSTDPSLPKEKWTQLTPTLYTKTTFTDENVETGKAYYYFVVAVDKAGNLSPISEVVSETVP